MWPLSPTEVYCHHEPPPLWAGDITPPCLLLWMPIHSLMVLQLTFLLNLEIPSSSIEVVQVIKLACSDTLINNILIYLATSIFGGIPVCGIIFSYSQIVSSVLRMPSASGKYKLFFHLWLSPLSCVPILWDRFCRCTLVLLLLTRPAAVVLSILYTIRSSDGEPFIYSLRNRDMKRP